MHLSTWNFKRCTLYYYKTVASDVAFPTVMPIARARPLYNEARKLWRQSFPSNSILIVYIYIQYGMGTCSWDFRHISAQILNFRTRFDVYTYTYTHNKYISVYALTRRIFIWRSVHTNKWSYERWWVTASV